MMFVPKLDSSRPIESFGRIVWFLLMLILYLFCVAFGVVLIKIVNFFRTPKTVRRSPPQFGNCV